MGLACAVLTEALGVAGGSCARLHNGPHALDRVSAGLQHPAAISSPLDSTHVLGLGCRVQGLKTQV